MATVLRLHSMRFLLLLCVLVTPSVAIIPRVPDNAFSKRQAASQGVLDVFQVYEPVLTPEGSSDQYGCVYTKTLMVHDFAFSYGEPFVGNYTPPPCSFNRVTMNFTVTVKGVQFDRLGLMYLGSTEVFRTSTAEPNANGIIWTYIKEMQQYDALWKQPQTVIFDLGNLVDSTYTGIYNTTLTATFFTVPDSPPVADQILPISSLSGGSNAPSAFEVPGQNASVTYTLPQNIQRAVISLEACGQSAEEFWYTNVFNSETNTFLNTAGSYYGYGPWREVQLYIDGTLAGVSDPFPIIFTGGIVPGFWRPIVGIDAFDLRQHEIDVTPWLGLLCNGAPHAFEIRVAGLNDDGAGHATISEIVNSYWVVTGTIFLFLDKAGHVTTGSPPTLSILPPAIKISSSVTATNGTNQTLVYNTAVTRSISISSTIKTSTGSHLAFWHQSITYNNFNNISAEGFDQFTSQNTSGTDTSASGYINTYSYPLTVFESFAVGADGSVGINGTISRGLVFNVFGPSVFPSGIQTFNVTSPATIPVPGQIQPQPFTAPTTLPKFQGSLLSTTQTGSAEYFSGPNSSYSFGTTEQIFSFSGAEVGEPGTTYELYNRDVKAVNSTIVKDQQTFAGQTFGLPPTAPGPGVKQAFGYFSVQALLGKGPGKTKAQLGGGP